MTWRDVAFFIFTILMVTALAIGCLLALHGMAGAEPYSDPPWISPDNKTYWEKRMAPKPESHLIKQILKFLRALPECNARKVHGGPFASAGEPDIDAVYRGVPLKLEAKVGGNKPTALQGKTLEDWRRAGAVTAVVRSVEDVEHIINELDRVFKVAPPVIYSIEPYSMSAPADGADQ